MSDVPEGYEKLVERILRHQFEMYKVEIPDPKTLECIKELAIFLITEEGRNATTTAAITAAHVIVPNYLYKDWIFHDLFMDAITRCQSGESISLGPNLIEEIERFFNV